MENNNNLVWESISFKEPQLTIRGNYIYFNSAMRDILKDSDNNGLDFFRTEIDGKLVLSCKSGNQFIFAKKKNESRIICNDLANYIVSNYNNKNHFTLVLIDGFYMLRSE